jgi:hypothetical protein
VKSGKNKFLRILTFKVRLQENTIFKRRFSACEKYGDHKQEKLVEGYLFFLTYFLIDESNNCQISSTLYPLKGLPGREFLRVVFIRTPNINPTKEDNYPYRYYAVVTDMSESEISNEKVIKFYRRRSQVENNIKDIKNGMDFHHFPCMNLKANNVWGLIGVIAYNLMRYASFAVVPERGCFVETTRKRIVAIAGEVITHARSIEIRMMNYIVNPSVIGANI